MSLPSVVILTAHQLQRALDPESYRSNALTTWWVMCRNAAFAALMVCCNLSAEEIARFRRKDWLPGGADTVRGDADGRTIPVIAAARCIVARYLDAMPAEIRGSEFLFVKPDGRPLVPTTVPESIRNAGRRIGLVDDLTASLRATFRAAVAQDKTCDNAAMVLAPPSRRPSCIAGGGGVGIDRLRRLLEEYHPLAPFGRIRFFETKKPVSPLLAEILGCTETLKREPEEIKTLRRTILPEVAEHRDRGRLTYKQAGKWFGVTKDQVRQWVRIYKRRGEAGLLGWKTGNMDQASRTAVLAAISDGVPYDNLTQFHDYLWDRGLRYSKATVKEFLIRSGVELPEPRRSLNAAFRDAIAFEAASLSPPPNIGAFYELLQHKYGFDFSFRALRAYLQRGGWKPAAPP